LEAINLGGEEVLGGREGEPATVTADKSAPPTADKKVGKDDQRPKRGIIVLTPMMRREGFEYDRLLFL
jgi:hypothetical protein